MNINSKTIPNLINLLIVSFVLIACASTQPNQTKVNIEKEASSGTRIQDVVVTSSASTTVVSGTLHTKRRVRTTLPGHIDITILSPNGEVLHKLKTEYERSAIEFKNFDFRTEIPVALPNGSTVRVKHHRIKLKSTEQTMGIATPMPMHGLAHSLMNLKIHL